MGSSESFGEGQRDGYMVKTDRFGNKLFSQSYGGSRDDNIEAIIPFKDGYVMAGSTYSFGNGNENLYVVRTDAKGELVWEKGFYEKKRDRLYR